MLSDGAGSTMSQLHMTCFYLQCISSLLLKVSPDSTASPVATSMLATVPSCGATTGISIFIASRMMMESPAFTACPTLASTLHTLPGTEAVTFTLPAPAAAFGSGFRCCLSSCLRCCFGSCCRCCCASTCSFFLYGYVICSSVYCDRICFHFDFLLYHLGSAPFVVIGFSDGTNYKTICGCAAFICCDCCCNHCYEFFISCKLFLFFRFRCCRRYHRGCRCLGSFRLFVSFLLPGRKSV